MYPPDPIPGPAMDCRNLHFRPEKFGIWPTFSIGRRIDMGANSRERSRVRSLSLRERLGEGRDVVRRSALDRSKTPLVALSADERGSSWDVSPHPGPGPARLSLPKSAGEGEAIFDK